MSIRALSWSLAAATLCLSAAGGAQAQIVIGGGTTNVSCNGGSNGTATASPSGGDGFYTYTWTPYGGTSPTATGLAAGSFTVEVRDGSGATATRNYTVTQPTLLAANPWSQSNVSTNGGADGAASVSVSGGMPGYTYSWAPSGGTASAAVGLTAGTYTVTVMDANTCTAQQSFTITEPAAGPAATVASVGVPANGAYTPGQTLSFTVNFSEAVTVNTTGGTPSIALTVGAATRYATYQSGSGSSSLTFRYTVQPGDLDSDGIAIGALGLNGGTIRNGSTNVVLTLNSVGATNAVLVTTPPPAAVPTLTEWAMILLTGLLALFGAARLGLLPARKS
ncbi:IPTL-CTERM sorting domain-containing protein [Brevundimonas sp.]|uniref:IPTL-CTERM sorting domain-containing protein n=1 Tax=Brevundimonas sp. TaxID=1871086 RepID=UPI0028A14DE2|nr:IPTL-CTERM sorting domain-containing protein [Brevundimonas sp.]